LLWQLGLLAVDCVSSAFGCFTIAAVALAVGYGGGGLSCWLWQQRFLLFSIVALAFGLL